MPDSALPPNPDQTRSAKQPLWLWALAGVWIVCVVGGLSVLWAYDNTPGGAAVSPERWPTETRLARTADRPTLILLAHPQCPCTRTSLAELAEVLARADTLPKTYVLFLSHSASRSRPGEGSRIRVRLPLEITDTAMEPAAPVAAA